MILESKKERIPQIYLFSSYKWGAYQRKKKKKKFGFKYF